jgi:hypothetical protein
MWWGAGMDVVGKGYKKRLLNRYYIGFRFIRLIGKK